MTPDEYRKWLAMLGLTQKEAARLLGYAIRSTNRWAAEGPPQVVAMLLLCVGANRRKLDRLHKATGGNNVTARRG